MNPKFLNIKDKKIISEERFCPPHYFPHKIPIGEKIKDEYCHLHERIWRMVHHDFFCKFLGCENYEFMIEKYREPKK